jgi:hypothetical protein
MPSPIVDARRARAALRQCRSSAWPSLQRELGVERDG